MRLSKVAKELNVGIANIVDHLSSKGIDIDGRPNTKITPDAYEILRQEFSADVEQHKRSEEVALARREEKEAIKAAATKKAQLKDEVIKAKVDFVGPKTVGKIDVVPKAKKEVNQETPAKKVVEPATKTTKPKTEVKETTEKPTSAITAKDDSKISPSKKKEVIKA